MTDPYQPKARAYPPGPVFPTARLRRAGASPQYLAAAGEAWDGMGVEERAELADELALMTDSELAEKVRAEAPAEPEASDGQGLQFPEEQYRKLGINHQALGAKRKQWREMSTAAQAAELGLVDAQVAAQAAS